MTRNRKTRAISRILPPHFTIKPYSLVVLGKERTVARPIIFCSDKKYIKLDFIDDELEKIWAFPSSCVTKIIYSVVFDYFLWFAFKIPPLPGKKPKVNESQFEVMFTLREEKQESLSLLLHFFKESCPSVGICLLCPVTFFQTVGSYYDDILLYDLFADNGVPATNEEKTLEKTTVNVQPQEDLNDSDDFELDQIVVQFKDGQRKTVMHQYLVQSLEPKGWLCTSLMDIMLEYFLQERLSQFPEWNNDVIFYDSMFFQKIFKYNTLLQTVTIDNYSKIMHEIYPTKAGICRGVPIVKKELIVIPVIIKKHWLLVLIHKPMYALLDIDSEYSIDLESPKQRCRILIMDSKTGDESVREILNGIHQDVYDCIRLWLVLMLFNIEEYPNTRYGCVYVSFLQPYVLPRKVVCDKLPKQPNDDDCGVFALLFLEEFVLNNWSWTDLSYEKMSDICVEKDEEFHEKTLTYRSFLSDVVKELAVNLPLNEL